MNSLPCSISSHKIAKDKYECRFSFGGDFRDMQKLSLDLTFKGGKVFTFSIFALAQTVGFIADDCPVFFKQPPIMAEVF